ncbi:Putative peptidoglycan binding domain-containing protein [Cohaesibacter sp. ES.047]|uniref:L,D-transpeptidase family protein n=1 Tax=Cohaesibacter sp. ES.047 TaxID=1798205 RepID=UPI000BB900BF|nr:L,D-transpeptidase family protein [Cohaesibacter sp. ES.047]SNY91866.1 Putative peptidoglycan binding domain-containing protein [Cohaesibacter sp. ES.047]
MNKSAYLCLVGGLLLATTGLSQANEQMLGALPASPVNTLALTPEYELPIQIIISRKDQRARVFRGTEEIATSRVSTGKRGHTTPTGIFSILEKRRRHYSNLYNSAPMPYMQRLTWSGIALHQSNSVPGYPASHGCVRLPGGFAKQLFSITERGAHVIIANREAVPEPIEHANLFQPREVDDLAAQVTSVAATPEPIEALGKISLLNEHPVRDTTAHQVARYLNQLEAVKHSDKPLRIFITRQARGNVVKEVQTLLNELGYDAGVVDGLAGSATMAALRAFIAAQDGSMDQRSYGAKPRIDQALLQNLYNAAGKGKIPTGHLFVRHNFKPLFDAPIRIRDTKAPLGAHLFTANAVAPDKLNWLAVNLDDKLSDRQQARLGVKQDPEHPGGVDAATVLDRVIIPEDIRAQINHLVGNGASLTISDRGFSRETTPQGTDFIVLTKPNKRSKVAKTVSKVKRQATVKRSFVEPKPTAPKRRTLFSMLRARTSD